MDAHPAPTDLKRKRSPSHETSPTSACAASHAAPPPKQAKTSQHLQINYLARQYNEDLPLVSNNDTLPSIITLLNEYQGVLERHESMAGNLGARPLGPILIKRFERLFDGPPKVLKGKEGVTVTWLDVVEFARNKPEQFQLGQMSEGHRVCQFYTKQCRVQISEEDYVLISSGIPQKMIPPQPIVEDEEKELGTLEILEKNLANICQLADQVAARTRQLNHRIKGRKQAILDRRATDQGVSIRATSPSNIALMNGNGSGALSSAGFVAVNARQQSDQNGSEGGSNRTGAQPSTREELLNKFFTLSDRRGQNSSAANGDLRRSSVSLAASALASGANKPAPQKSTYAEADYAHLIASSSPVAIPSTPSSLLQTHNTTTHHPPHSHSTHSHTQSYHSTPHSHTPLASSSTAAAAGGGGGSSSGKEKTHDDGGPYKAEMVSRMEGLAKGERVIPPCDRCRRLHMDCLKNLTACMGCTKKHAKCSWREVKEGELVRGTPYSLGVDIGLGRADEGLEGATWTRGSAAPGAETSGAAGAAPEGLVYAGRDALREMSMSAVAAAAAAHAAISVASTATPDNASEHGAPVARKSTPPPSATHATAHHIADAAAAGARGGTASGADTPRLLR